MGQSVMDSSSCCWMAFALSRNGSPRSSVWSNGTFLAGASPVQFQLSFQGCVEEVYSLGNSSRNLSRIKRNLKHLNHFLCIWLCKDFWKNSGKYNFEARFTVPKEIDICWKFSHHFVSLFVDETHPLIPSWAKGTCQFTGPVKMPRSNNFIMKREQILGGKIVFPPMLLFVAHCSQFLQNTSEIPSYSNFNLDF